MQTISAEMFVEETRQRGGNGRGLGRWENIAEVRALNTMSIIGAPAAEVEGSLTFHGIDLKPGQRIKAEFTILDD